MEPRNLRLQFHGRNRPTVVELRSRLRRGFPTRLSARADAFAVYVEPRGARSRRSGKARGGRRGIPVVSSSLNQPGDQLTIFFPVIDSGNAGTTQSLHAADDSRGIVRRMTIHVVWTRNGGRSESLKGLCGALVVGLYVRRVDGHSGPKSHLCPSCEALAPAAAARSSHPRPARVPAVLRAHFVGRHDARTSTPERPH